MKLTHLIPSAVVAALCLLAGSGSSPEPLAFAQAPPKAASAPVAKITGPTSPVQLYVMVKLSAEGSTGQGFAWLSFSKGISGGQLPGGKEYWFTGAPGEYQIALIVTDAGTIATDQITVTIGIPPPVPPVPPGPVPPIPPTPIPVKGMRVLFVCEKSDNLTREQLNIWNSTAIRSYLDQHTAKDGWRFWDDDTDISKSSDVWKSIRAVAKDVPLPAIVIFSDQTGQYFPWPATEAATLEFLKSKGG
jgi:hypothetical protein